jgi:hypothetical protein
LQPRLTLAASGVNALAVSDSWVVYRDQDAAGGEHLIAVSLASPSTRRYLAGSRLAGQVGRPSLDGASVVFTVDTPRRSAIELVELTSGHRHTLRAAGHGAAFFYPSLLGGGLLYERVTRCVQQLRIGAASRAGRASFATGAAYAGHARSAARSRSRRERVLLSLSSTVARDPGYQAGYTHAYNSASGCVDRATGGGGARQLGSTALGASRAYVTVSGPTPGDVRVLALGR